MLIFLWILGLFLTIGLTAFSNRRAEIGRILIQATGMYFCLYIIVSGLLIFVNHFTMIRTTLGIILLELIYAAILTICHRWQPLRLKFSWKKYIAIAIILIGAALLSGNKAGYYGTGQDEGLYQIRAMFYMGGQFDNVVDFPEYYSIANQGEKAEYLAQVQDMTGFYLLSDDGAYNVGDVSGVLHGVATFPALLALWGKMFGLCNMTGILTIFYLLAVANTWLICRNLKIKNWLSCIVIALMAVCPIVLWCAQNTLTEIIITAVICIFFELLTENAKKKITIFSALPMVAASFLHVTISIFMPLVVMLYFVGYLLSKRKQFITAMMITLLGYALGMNMMMKTARHYTIKNLSSLFNLTNNLLNENNLELIVWIGCITLCVIATILLIPIVRKNMYLIVKKCKASDIAGWIVGILISLITILLVVFFIYKGMKANGQGMWPMKLSILGYIFMTGYVFLPCAIIGIIINGKEMLRHRNQLMFAISLIYVLFVYCGIVRVLIFYYYYYARYFAPFVILVLIGGAIGLNRLKHYFVAPVGVAMILLVMMQSSFLYEKKDLTFCDYTMIDSITSCVDANDVVLVLGWGNPINRIFPLPIKGITGADIFYVEEATLPEKAATFSGQYENVYLLQYDFGYIKSDVWSYVYQGKMQTCIYDNSVSEGLPYAQEASEFETPVSLMLYMGE